MDGERIKGTWDENGIYREYDENGKLILEQTYYGSISGNCEVGRRLLSNLQNGVRFTWNPTARVDDAVSMS